MPSFESPIGSSCPVSDDHHDFPAPPPGKLKGLNPTVDVDGQFCAEPFLSPFPQNMYIPRSEWDDRIEEIERDSSSIHDMALHYGVKIKDQNGFGWCWGFGACTAVELARAGQGLDYVELSASSVCGPVKNYRNEGGWGKEALDYGVRHGWAPVSMWPECPVGANPRYDTEASRQEREKYKVDEWWEIPNRDFDALMSALFHKFPAAVGLNHWGHLICAAKPVKSGGNYGWLYRNSWKASWGDNGCGVLLASKAIPDGITVVPRVTTVVGRES